MELVGYWFSGKQMNGRLTGGMLEDPGESALARRRNGYSFILETAAKDEAA